MTKSDNSSFEANFQYQAADYGYTAGSLIVYWAVSNLLVFVCMVLKRDNYAVTFLFYSS